MRYNKKDHYHQLAKKEGFLARSAYKLQEIQKKFHLIKRGSKILDLGCAPGAWTQVALPLVGSQGIVIGIDLEPVDGINGENVRFLQMDAFALTKEQLPEAPFDVVLSDMAPKTSGVKVRDQALSAELCLKAIQVCDEMLKPGGHLVIKLFEGEDANRVTDEIKKRFQELKRFRPESTRQASMEIYVLGIRKK